MNKLFFCGFLLLFLSGCEEKKPAQASQTQNNEQVIEDPVTPLGTIDEKSLRAINPLNDPKDSVPIILVHGFLGFGRDEMLGYRYWGGFKDLQEVLIEAGFSTFTASVGPVSSNYDRAIELYYQIKGGCVNYGEAHSSKYGHAKEVNKCYTGFYPQWDETHPVHLIGHSQGGQTVRTLVALLENGFASEKAKPNHAALFDGQRYKWVKSVTTIATPNDGTSLTGVIKDFTPFIQSGIATLTSLSGLNGKTNIVYDFDLEQWGLKRNKGESFDSYTNRIYSSQIWNKNNKDFASWDLSPQGALELNNWVGTSLNTYYFSISTKATNTGLITRWEYPKLTMNPLFSPLATPLLKGMGNYTQSGSGMVTIDKSWWKNDGVVNTISMKGPKGATILDYTGQSVEKGIWYNKPLYNGYDHFDIIGLSLFTDVRPLYLNHAGLISSLPR